MEKNNKDGVAVIIVLGLLALLMVLGVTFSVSMRVERAGAANYATAVKNRQMVWAGLSRAIGKINSTIGDDMFPEGDFLVSGSSTWGSNTASGVKLLKSPSVTNELPGVLSSLASQVKSEWIPIGGSSDDREGYVAYAVLNLSDMLDLHYVGGTNRSGGLDARELALVPGLLTAAAMDNLDDARRSDGPFETLGEFRAYYGRDVSTEAFVDYSRFLPDTNRTGAVYIGTNVAEMAANRTAIIGAMRAVLGVGNLRQESVWFDYLLDYVDTNMAPRRLNGPNAKPVPLLNEVAPAVGANALSLGQTTLSGDIVVEVWNPSMTVRQGTYFKIIGNISTTVVVSNDLGVVVAYTNAYDFSTYPRNRRFLSPAADRFGIAGFPAFQGNWPPVAATNNPKVGVSISVRNLAVILDADGSVVDSATNVLFRFTYAGNYIAGPLALTPASWQTVDPRVNWHQRGWTNAPATLGADGRSGLHNAGQQGKQVFAAERGGLYSALELGHLLCLGVPTAYDRGRPIDETEWSPWREFKVYGTGRHKLLEKFTTQGTGSRRGLVNANSGASSGDPSLLQLAFEQLPAPAPAVAAAAANYVVGHTQTNRFRSVSDMLDLPWQTNVAGLAVSDVQSDLLLSYSTGLLGVRQNLFLVVVAASGASQGMGSGGSAGVAEVDTRNSKRAMAVVWRDPVKNSVGQYDCFVRMFKWLD